VIRVREARVAVENFVNITDDEKVKLALLGDPNNQVDLEEAKKSYFASKQKIDALNEGTKSYALFKDSPGYKKAIDHFMRESEKKIEQCVNATQTVCGQLKTVEACLVEGFEERNSVDALKTLGEDQVHQVSKIYGNFSQNLP